MTQRLLLIYLLFILSAVYGCGKEDKSNPIEAIDVSMQWLIDQSGNIMIRTNDTQWERKIFSNEELNYFTSLDTLNLTGTSSPDSVKGIINYFYPNPFVNTHRIGFLFTNGYSGQFVLKYVIVDSLMNAVEKKSARLQSNPPFSTTMVAIWPTVPVGRFRLYITLSSALQHIFISRGGISRRYNKRRQLPARFSALVGVSIKLCRNAGDRHE